MIKDEYSVIGLMSGTSLDGLDIAHCTFFYENKIWKYEIRSTETVIYSKEWLNKLKAMETADVISFLKTDNEYGEYCGMRVSDFIIKNNIKADFVASHGHTIFHQPENKLTVQIGSGCAIAAKCKLPVVHDFRSLDVALGGQGAPLVPIGDKLLFSHYEYCLNLGGIANVSYEYKGNRIAYDICPVNMILNQLCKPLGKAFDNEGELARSGMTSTYLLNELNQLPFYKITADSPKSLGKEWIDEHVFPLLNKYELSEQDMLHTFCEHIALQIAKTLNSKTKGKLLITGGGAYNSYLVELITKHCAHQIIIPDKKTIEYKEALIFAFLGVMRMRNEINTLKSVTGAMSNSVGGKVVLF